VRDVTATQRGISAAARRINKLFCYYLFSSPCSRHAAAGTVANARHIVMTAAAATTWWRVHRRNSGVVANNQSACNVGGVGGAACLAAIANSAYIKATGVRCAVAACRACRRWRIRASRHWTAHHAHCSLHSDGPLNVGKAGVSDVVGYSERLYHARVFLAGAHLIARRRSRRTCIRTARIEKKKKNGTQAKPIAYISLVASGSGVTARRQYSERRNMTNMDGVW